VNEFERAQLAMAEQQNETLKRLEAALSEHGRTLAGVLATLENMSSGPNVVRLSSRLRQAEGEISELHGKVARLDADIGRMGSGAG
jgi:chromosome segregation ATPase